MWVNENEERGKNLNEAAFLKAQLQRSGINSQFSYSKITNLRAGRELAQSLNNHKKDDLVVVVYNFVDIISHAKTEMEIIKELASDNRAFRSYPILVQELSPTRNHPTCEKIRIQSNCHYRPWND